MLRRTTRLPILIALVGLIALLVAFGPPERSLGVHVRVVYLHGAWVWTALVGFAAAAAAGAVGLAFRRRPLQMWSGSFARAAMVFWVTYLPISLVAMQANWNGLFLDEPRWRIGLDFAIVAVLLQAGLHALGRPAWASALNIVFFGALVLALVNAQQVMHPASPIISSPSSEIRAYFAVLVGLCMLTGWQLARWFQRASA
ncbi:MAG TPA: hypothetical protein VJK02_22325 [Anaerolineales bacterium]|nr:hypothetical protein [Anaerolineales bacterium]